MRCKVALLEIRKQTNFLIVMKKQVIFAGMGARVLSKNEMKHVIAGSSSFESVNNGRDLTACNNKTCTGKSDCGSGACASMECNGKKEYHCI